MAVQTEPLLVQTSANHELDWPAVQRLSAALTKAGGSGAEIGCDTFGISLISHHWAGVPTLLHPVFHDLHVWWARCRGRAALPNHERIDPFDLRQWLGDLVILEPEHRKGQLDFRYRLFGARLAGRTGFDANGKTLRTFPMDTNARQFVFATHCAVLSRQEPLLVSHVPSSQVPFSIWERLILPFADDDGNVARLLVMSRTDQDRPDVVRSQPIVI